MVNSKIWSLVAVACFVLTTAVCFSEETQQRKYFDIGGELKTGYVDARFFSLYGTAQDYGYHNLKLWSGLALRDELEFRAQIKNEGIWENRKAEFLSDRMAPETRLQCILDELFIKFRPFKEFLRQVIAGRQKIFYGDGFLVADGSPEFEFDKEHTAFDAARLQFDTGPVKTDLFGAIVEANTDHIFSGLHSSLANKNTSLDGYYYRLDLRDLDNPVPGVLKSYSEGDYINTTGFRASAADSLDEGTNLYLESAFQAGKRCGSDLQAWAAQAGMSYQCRLRPSILAKTRFDYTYLSGDKPDTAKTEEFIPLFSSKEYGPIYTLITEDKNSSVVTNINVSNVYIGARIFEKLDLRADFYYIQENKPQRSHISDEVVYSLSYDFDEMVSTEISYAYLDIRQRNIGTGTSEGNRVLRLITVMTKVRF